MLHRAFCPLWTGSRVSAAVVVPTVSFVIGPGVERTNWNSGSRMCGYVASLNTLVRALVGCLSGVHVGQPEARRQVDSILTYLGSEAVLAAQTREKLSETADHLATFCEARGTLQLEDLGAADVRLFVNARNRTGGSPALATRHLRRTNLRILFSAGRSLGHRLGDPTLDVSLPPRSLKGTRPLTENEISLCRLAARRRPRPDRKTAAFALAEATATTGEMPYIELHHLDLESGTLELPGSRHNEARTGQLTEWGARMLTGWVSRLPAGSGVIYNGDGRSLKGPQSSASQLIYKILELAGLSGEPDVRAGSIGAWAARCIFDETNDIAAAARALGARSLDTAARRIGWNWTEDGR